MSDGILIAPSTPLRVIIAGSRRYRGGTDGVARAVAASGLNIGTVICGCARGADAAGEWWANEHRIPVEFYSPDWKAHGRGAGIIRNKKMAEVADSLIALWDGYSTGTRDMIERMADKPTFVYWEGAWG